MTAGTRCRAPLDAPSRRRQGRQGFPSAGPHRCAQIRRLVSFGQIHPTGTVMLKVAYKNPDQPRSSAAC